MAVDGVTVEGVKRETAEEVLAHIDEIVGPPEEETEEEHEARVRMIERDAEARRLRRGAL